MTKQIAWAVTFDGEIRYITSIDRGRAYQALAVFDSKHDAEQWAKLAIGNTVERVTINIPK